MKQSVRRLVRFAWISILTASLFSRRNASTASVRNAGKTGSATLVATRNALLAAKNALLFSAILSEQREDPEPMPLWK
jgi:hypothetical protein